MAETGRIPGPFEPDLVHTSVGKWSLCRVNTIILPLHFWSGFFV